MKVKPTAGAMHVRIAATQYSTQPSGVTSGSSAVTNFKTKSKSFHSMNNTVIRLDNQFKGLSPTDQATWNGSPSVGAGIQVCGCEGTIDTGQKLYRLVNYCRELFGQADVNTCPAPGTPGAGGNVNNGKYHFLFPGPTLGVIVEWATASASTYSIFNLGKGLANPVLHYIIGDGSIVLRPGDEYFDDFYNLAEGPNNTVCNFDDNFLPVDVNVLITIWED